MKAIISACVAILVSVSAMGCEDPIAYAESWEHNTCPSEIPSDEGEAMGAAIDLIREHGYTIVYKEGQRRSVTVMPLDRVELAEDADARHLWHELVHVRQDRSDGASSPHRAGAAEWRMAYEAQAYRQDILTLRAITSGSRVFLSSDWGDGWCVDGHEEWCRQIGEDAIHASDRECLDLVDGSHHP